MFYQIEHRLSTDEWFVKLVSDNGSKQITKFSGPNAEGLAKEYAEWKNSKLSQ